MQLRILTGTVVTALMVSTASAQYKRTDLVSNQPGVAPTTEQRLVNAWGLVALPTSPFWVSDNGTGKSTLYAVTNDSSGAPQVSKVGLEVNIPGEGNPTGQVFNNVGGFNGDNFPLR